MNKHPRLLMFVGVSLGIGLMGMKPHSPRGQAPSVILARPPFNCFTREVWSPAKQAWCEHFGPASGENENQSDVLKPEHWDGASSDRTHYTPIALNNLPSQTRLSGADPKAIALSIVDLPETEGNSQTQTSVTRKQGQSAVVLLSRVGLADDSVQGIRYRLEFAPESTLDNEAQWQLIWVGRQQLCWPDRGPENWTNRPCS